jgi:hypothetical protein
MYFAFVLHLYGIPMAFTSVPIESSVYSCGVYRGTIQRQQDMYETALNFNYSLIP